ncbi:MAG: methyltransferase [Gammaproteobacteria bacterium]
MSDGLAAAELGAPDPRLAELLLDYPRHWFTDKLYRSSELAHHYCGELVVKLLHDLELAKQLRAWSSPDSLREARGFSSRFENALAWLLAFACENDLLERQEQHGVRRYRLHDELREPQLENLRELGLALDPGNAATLDLLDAAAQAYPAVATGAASGEQALFGMGQINLWLAYFNNEHALYAINNRLCAAAAANRLADKKRLRILEVGAGAGSGAEALLQVLAERELADRIAQYTITEPQALFRRRGERALKTRYPNLPLAFQSLDMNEPWKAQGIAPAGFDLVFAVNALHVAKDLMFTLREARQSLDSGWLVAGECLRPFAGQALYTEMMFQILDSFTEVQLDPAYRPNPGFLTPEQWRSAIRQAGFEQVEITPDLSRIREIYPRFATGAVCGC